MKRQNIVTTPPSLDANAPDLPPAPQTVSIPDFPQALPGIDLPTALARLSGNRNSLLRFLQMFRHTWSGVIDQLRAALAQDALQQAHLTAHSLHGAAAMLSMPEVVATAKELEIILHQENRERISAALEGLAKALSPVLAGLTQLSPEPAPVQVSPAETLPLLRILAIDDVPENLELLGYYLKDSPFELVHAISGEDALLRFEAGQFDCVLLDMQLPGMSGPETLHALRAIEATRMKAQTPVIGISAGGSTADFQKALAAGCAAYLPRPVEKADLLSAILDHCFAGAGEEPTESPGTGPSCGGLSLNERHDGGDTGGPNRGVAETTTRTTDVTDEHSLLPAQEEQADAAARGKLLPRVLARLTACAEELSAARRRGRFAEAGKLGHIIRGLGMTFGLSEAERLGSEIERAAKDQDSERIEELTGQVRELSR